MSNKRKADADLKCICGHCPTCYERNWSRNHRRKTRAYSRKWRHKDPIRKAKLAKKAREYFAAYHAQEICNILKKHGEDLKDDPEKLSTAFLQNLIGIKCEKKEM